MPKRTVTGGEGRAARADGTCRCPRAGRVFVLAYKCRLRAYIYKLGLKFELGGGLGLKFEPGLKFERGLGILSPAQILSWAYFLSWKF